MHYPVKEQFFTSGRTTTRPTTLIFFIRGSFMTIAIWGDYRPYTWFYATIYKAAGGWYLNEDLEAHISMLHLFSGNFKDIIC